MNVRFWEFVNNDWVKLTLKPHQVLNHTRFWPNEEAAGFGSETVRWHYDWGGVLNSEILRQTHGSSEDCDGVMEKFYEDSCPVQDLHVPVPEGVVLDGITFPPHRPKWNEVSSSQRDHTAEAMGY